MPFVLPKIPVPKLYTCTISPFPYYNGKGEVQYDQVMNAINQPDSAIHKELVHKLGYNMELKIMLGENEATIGDLVHITNLSLVLVITETNPYYRFEKAE